MIFADATRYTLLLSSLPYLPPPLSRQRFIPPTRLQIGKALRQLSERDAERMQAISEVLFWSYLPMVKEDAHMVEAAERLLAKERSALLHGALLERLEMRTLVAALRRRELGRMPEPGERWGVGRYTVLIRRNWHDPAFGLGHLFGWLNEAQHLLRAGETLAFDRLLMMESWRCLQRIEDTHGFGFDAVALYVMRWEILNRLGRQHEAAAVSRFESMVNEALTGHELVFHD